jgi:SAM-dependent methyltransferase
VPAENIDPKTVSSFGEEWNAFHGFSESDIIISGDKYFDIVTDEMLNKESLVIDIGCGSGRFIKYLKGRYKKIVGLDPSSAIFVADNLLGEDGSIELVQASTDNIPYPDSYFDFGYSLGVFHHIPDTQKALSDSVKKIKPGGYFLLYLYYSLDNRSFLFKLLFHISNAVRLVVSKLPARIKKFVCDVLAVVFYMPFVGLCRLLKVIGIPQRIRRKIPLQAYEDQSFYIIRNDSLDRFGTSLEQRFSRAETKEMMENAGLTQVNFSERIPYWHAVGKKI